MLKPTISWDYPVDSYVSDRKFRTIFSKEFEYSKGKFAKFKVVHDWQTGECAIIAPCWAKRKDCDFYGKVVYRGKDTFKLETLEFVNKNKGNRFVGTKVSSRGHLPYSKCTQEMGSKITIGQKIQHFHFTVIDGNLLIRCYRFRCHLPKDGEIDGIKEYKRIFFKNGNVWAEYPEPLGYKYHWEKKNIKKSLNRLFYVKRDVIHMDADAFDLLKKEFEGIIFENVFGLFNFLPSEPQNTSFQLKVSEFDKLVKPLDKNHGFFKSFYKYDTDRKTPYLGSDNFKGAYCEKINDNLVVARLFLKSKNDFFEYARVYFDDKRVYPCYFNKNQSTRCNTLNRSFWDLDIAFSFNHFDANTVLKTRFASFEGLQSECAISKLIFAQKYLFLEQFEKIGLHRLFKNIALDKTAFRRFVLTFRNGNFKGLTKLSVKDFFSSYEQKRLLLFKDCISTVSNVENLLFLFNNCKIKDIDTFKYLSNIFNSDATFEGIDYFVRIFRNICLRCSEKQIALLMRKFAIQFQKIQSILFNGFQGERRFYSYVNTVASLGDTCSMLSNIIDDDNELYSKLIELTKIYNPDKILDKHDDLVSLVKFHEYPQERYDRVKSAYSAMEFSDEDFIVRLPQSTKEIVEEGNKMHHCVGSYVDDVMNGNTIIMLLRKRTNPEANYVTIELNRENYLIQAKCKYNEVVSSQKTLSFLTKWIKEKRIRLRTHDLTFKDEKVYVASNPYIGYHIEADSVVDKNGKAKVSA